MIIVIFQGAYNSEELKQFDNIGIIKLIYIFMWVSFLSTYNEK